MCAHQNWTAVQRMCASAVPVAVATWLVSAPAVVEASSLLVVWALFTGFGWVVYTTHRNGLLASRSVPVAPGAAHASASTGRRRRRLGLP
jgi:hypothetical protein